MTCDRCGRDLSLCDHLDRWIAQATARLRQAEASETPANIEAAKGALRELYADKGRIEMAARLS